KVTMRDVAKAANVSQSTVSRILNPSSSAKSEVPISEETKEKVMAVVRELGYQPNQYARSLRGQKNHVIGMLIADISNPFYHPMVRAVQDVASHYHYSVMIANSDHLHEKEQLFCESLLRRPVDGAVLIPYHLTDDDLQNLMARTGMAISAVGNHIQHPNVDVAYADDTKASYEAIHWLIEQRGHQRIAMICADHKFPVIMRRYGAYRRAMEDAGLSVPDEYVVEGDWSPESGRRAIESLLALPEPPTAVFAASDTIAMGALAAAEDMNYRVPEDIAIIGFDDIPASSWVRPQLSTVAQYPAEMGTLLAKALFERIQGEYSGPSRRFEVPCRFLERASA
ncbi:MAG TPA: LacI family DNA-binding transcriptional regulator, partial [Anaerolineales bacterium]|nr:LacI family DNA-binding transcriptional regulator [Anaerolineales bacterium]